MLAQNALERYSRQLESLMESVVGILLIVLVGFVFFEHDPGLLEVQPHPFLFLTILIASRYGLFDGFFCSALCATVYTSFLFWNKDWDFVVKAFEWHRLIPAYLFVIMGLLLGEIREMANREVLEAKEDARLAKERDDAARRELEIVTKVKEELQHRILTAEDPLARFYESANRLSVLRPEETYPAILDLVERFTGAEKFSIYMAKEREPGVVETSRVKVFELRFSRGFERPDEFPTVLTTEHPAVARAVQTLSVVTIKEGHEGAADVLACAPMVDPAEGKVIGLIVINRIPFVRLTRLTVSHLQTIAGWAGKSLSESARLFEAMQARVDDETTGLFNYDYMSRRLSQEIQRAGRYGGECSLLLVKIIGTEGLEEEDRKFVLRDFGLTIRKLLRFVDVVGTHRLPGVYCIILPSTNPARTVVVTSRIHEAFRQKYGGLGSRFSHLSLKMGISHMSYENRKTEAEMVAEAERFQLV